MKELSLNTKIIIVTITVLSLTLLNFILPINNLQLVGVGIVADIILIIRKLIEHNAKRKS